MSDPKTLGEKKNEIFLFGFVEEGADVGGEGAGGVEVGLAAEGVLEVGHAAGHGVALDPELGGVAGEVVDAVLLP